MHRLLQGDVGSGKTIVALAAILSAIEAGYQVAFLVPTEVLAEQHFEVIKRSLQNLTIEDGERIGGKRGVEVELLSNKVTGTTRKKYIC